MCRMVSSTHSLAARLAGWLASTYTFQIKNQNVNTRHRKYLRIHFSRLQWVAHCKCTTYVVTSRAHTHNNAHQYINQPHMLHHVNENRNEEECYFFYQRLCQCGTKFIHFTSTHEGNGQIREKNSIENRIWMHIAKHRQRLRALFVSYTCIRYSVQCRRRRSNDRNETNRIYTYSFFHGKKNQTK